MFYHAQILGVKDVGSSLVLKDWHVLAWAFLLNDGIFPAAWMCTGSLVGISSYQIVAEQAASGIGNAHGTVNESFDLHVIRDICTDLLDLLEGKLTRCYNTLRPKVVPESVGFIVCIICLCTDMALDLRADLTRIGKDSRVCDDKCIRL